MDKERNIRLILEEQIMLYEFFSSKLLKYKKPKFFHDWMVGIVTRRTRRKYAKYFKKFMILQKHQQEQNDAKAFKENTKKAINKLYSIPIETDK